MVLSYWPMGCCLPAAQHLIGRVFMWHWVVCRKSQSIKSGEAGYLNLDEGGKGLHPKAFWAALPFSTIILNNTGLAAAEIDAGSYVLKRISNS